MTSSKGSPLVRDATGSVLVRPEGLGAQQREEDHVADRRPVGEEHRQPVDPDASPAVGGSAVLERANVVLVETVRLVVPAARASSCCSKRRRCSWGSFSSE